MTGMQCVWGWVGVWVCGGVCVGVFTAAFHIKCRMSTSDTLTHALGWITFFVYIKCIEIYFNPPQGVAYCIKYKLKGHVGNVTNHQSKMACIRCTYIHHCLVISHN